MAVTRQVSPSIGRCELSHIEREAIDLGRAIVQHSAYENCLSALGCVVHSLPAEPDLPDSVFVEDTAVVLDECAVMTRPGAVSRRPEIPAMARILINYRQLVEIEPPATLDGGDVLRIDRTLYVGMSRRSDEAAVAQLREKLAIQDYSVLAVDIADCLHLKAAATLLDPGRLLVNPDRVDLKPFRDMDLVEVDPQEPDAANALAIGDAVLLPAAYPLTRRRIEELGLSVLPVEISELAKAEGAVTCCSLIFGC